MTENKSPAASFLLTRQPIFDAKKLLWGYQLLTKEGGESTAATVGDIASAPFLGLQHIVARNKKIMVSFDGKSILEEAPYALPPAHTVIKVDQNLLEVEVLAEKLTKFREEGFRICLRVPPGEEPSELAQTFKPNLYSYSTLSTALGPKTSDPAGKPRHLVKHISDTGLFEQAKTQGFTLFQGPFFKEAEIIPDRKLTSHQISRFNLFKLIEQDDPDFNALADAIKTDVSISFRLLAYLNTAAFGFTQKVQSIKQAITLLGWKKIKNWLRAVLLSDMSTADEEVSELLLLSVQRGKFMEGVATDYDFWGFDPGNLFLLGMFSLLDAMLGMPMTQIVDYLPLDAKLRAALCRDPNNEYIPLFTLMEALEDADWHKLDGVIQNLSLDPEKIKISHAAAMDWANAFFTMPKA